MISSVQRTPCPSESPRGWTRLKGGLHFRGHSQGREGPSLEAQGGGLCTSLLGVMQLGVHPDPQEAEVHAP